MLGWNDQHLHRQGHVQRPWRCSESSEGQAGDCGDCRARTGRRCSGCGARGYRGQVIHGDQVSADSHRRQYRSDRRDGQMQRRHLLQISTPQRHVLESWRRCGVADGCPVGWQWARGRLAADLLVQQGLERRPDVLEQYRLSGSIGMNVITLQ
jgi:hypothetical protein